MTVSARLMLALALALVATGAGAQDVEECSNPEGWRPSPEELRATLRAHQEWIDNGGGEDPRRPRQSGPVQRRPERGPAPGRRPVRGPAPGRRPDRGQPFSGGFVGCQPECRSARRDRPRRGQVLTRAPYGTRYEPATAPAAGYLTGLEGLTTLRFAPGAGSGIAQLRARLAEVGLQDLERRATYALERGKTHHLLFRGAQTGRQDRAEQETLRWGEPLKLAEGIFRLVAFQWPVAYGLHPGRALLALLGSISVFALVYLIPLTRAGTGGIHCVWPEGRLEARSSTAELVGRAKVERLRPRGWWGLSVLGRALQFSTLSAFHLGWRELNVGTWLARVQTREYTLRATGWVRAVAGVQSLLSVYLLALWALTYFGRPFG